MQRKSCPIGQWILRAQTQSFWELKKLHEKNMYFVLKDKLKNPYFQVDH